MTREIAWLIARSVYAVATIYMIMILLRWTAPHLEIDLNSGKWHYIKKLTEPLIKKIREILPSLGPMDFAPIATLLAVWIAREIIVNILMGR